MTQNGDDSTPDAADPKNMMEISRGLRQTADNVERMARGGVEAPWPSDSRWIFVAAAGAFTGGGYVIGHASGTPGEQSGLGYVGIAALVAGAVLVSIGRWYHSHFENGEQPTYDDGEKVVEEAES